MNSRNQTIKPNANSLTLIGSLSEIAEASFIQTQPDDEAFDAFAIARFDYERG